MLFDNRGRNAQPPDFSEKAKNWGLGWTVEEARASAQRTKKEKQPSASAIPREKRHG